MINEQRQENLYEIAYDLIKSNYENYLDDGIKVSKYDVVSRLEYEDDEDESQLDQDLRWLDQQWDSIEFEATNEACHDIYYTRDMIQTWQDLMPGRI